MGNGQSAAQAAGPQALRIVVTPEAADDIERLEAWLFDKNPDAGHRAVIAIANAIRSLNQFPHRGYLAGLQMRHLHVAFGKRGYIIRYEVTDTQVRIQRIFHGLEDR